MHSAIVFLLRVSRGCTAGFVRVTDDYLHMYLNYDADEQSLRNWIVFSRRTAIYKYLRLLTVGTAVLLWPFHPNDVSIPNCKMFVDLLIIISAKWIHTIPGEALSLVKHFQGRKCAAWGAGRLKRQQGKERDVWGRRSGGELISSLRVESGWDLRVRCSPPTLCGHLKIHSR